MKKFLCAAVMAAAVCMSLSATAVTGATDALDPGGAVLSYDRVATTTVPVPFAVDTVKVQNQCGIPGENATVAAPVLVYAIHVAGRSDAAVLRPQETFRYQQLAQNRKLSRLLDCRNSENLARATLRLANRRA